MRTFSGLVLDKLAEGVWMEFHCVLAALCGTSLSWPEVKSLCQLVLGWALEAGTIPKRGEQEASWRWGEQGFRRRGGWQTPGYHVSL